MKPLITAGLIMTLPFAAQAAPEVTQNSESSEVTQHMTEAQHSEWSDILSRYVQASDDGVNRFDYAGLLASEEDQVILHDYITHLAGQKLSELPDNERFAAYANLYNALTVRLILENYPVSSIMRIRPTLFSIGPWKKDIITLEGKETSLDDIEHGILRVQYDDPRVHYAVNCASYGCPNLQTKAWEAATLHEDLDKAARDYVNHPRGVTIRGDGRLQVSTIYKWFREDFGGNEKGVVAHLLQYAAPELAEKIRANPDIADHEYDWSLNSVE